LPPISDPALAAAAGNDGTWVHLQGNHPALPEACALLLLQMAAGLGHVLADTVSRLLSVTLIRLLLLLLLVMMMLLCIRWATALLCFCG
jgi:hypothetical protein